MKTFDTCDRCGTSYEYQAGVATLRIAVATGEFTIHGIQFLETGDLHLCKPCAAPVIEALSPLLKS